MTQLKRMNHKVNEDNRKPLVIGNIGYQKLCRFSNNGFWNNIGCLVSAPNFGIG